jgi:IS1 family transposase
VGREWFPLADFTPCRAEFDPPALHHNHYIKDDKGLAMNKLKPERQEIIIHALVEGSSIRSIERMTGVHRDTIMRLSLNVGNACETLRRRMMRDLTCERIELDEVWCYVGKKERHVRDADDKTLVGHFWTWVAMDADTKLVPTYIVGKRDAATARAFISDLASRLTNRVQLSSDKLPHYIEAIEAAFGADVDYGQIVKTYEAEPIGPGRYSPPKVVGVEKTRMAGAPTWSKISTSLIERQNLTMRMSMRRFTRLTNAFSKKVENLRAAVALHFAYYNLVRIHTTLNATPAVAAGITNRQWSIADLIRLAS